MKKIVRASIITCILALPTLLIKAQYSPTKINTVISYATSRIGKFTYGYGCPENNAYVGNCRNRIDCSALVQRAFRSAGINKLPRNSQQQANHYEGKLIHKKKDLKRGDLIFFDGRKDGRAIDHVGIVTSNSNGRVRFIHSSKNNNGIAYNYLQGRWAKIYKRGRRLFSTEKVKFEDNILNVLSGQYTKASTQRLTKADIEDLSPCQIKIMKNEIFARHGYEFHTNKNMIEYFESQDWYKNTPRLSKNGARIIKRYFNKFETYNINFLRKYEGSCD